jgi:hypothetical protein
VRPLFVLATALSAYAAIASAQEPTAPPPPAETAEEPEAEPGDAGVAEQAPAPAPPAPIVDKASAPPPRPAPPPEELRTRFSGSLRSEIFLSQRPRMREIAPGRYAIRNDNVFPFYETIRLRADELGVRGLSVHFEGWAGVDLANVYFDQRFVADPTYLYVQFHDYGLDLRLGRQMVFTGATRGLHIDGLYASYETPVHLGVEALGGLVVSPDIGPDWYRDQPARVSGDDFGTGYTDWQRPGDYAVGGRLFYRLATRASAGVSILNVTELSEVDRRLLGADLDLTPVRWLGLTGNAVLDMMVTRLQEANAALDFYPIEPLSFGLDYRHADPTLFLSHMSIFSVFSSSSYDSVGAEVRGRPIEWLQLTGAYHQRIYGYIDQTVDGGNGYDVARELGYDIAAAAAARFGKRRDGLVRVEYVRTTEADVGVHQVRGGAIIPLGVDGLRAAANAAIEFFDKAWNEPYTGTDAVSGASAASAIGFGYSGDIGLYYGNGTIETGGTFAHSSTPYAQQETRGMLKLIYNFAVGFSERRRP